MDNILLLARIGNFLEFISEKQYNALEQIGLHMLAHLLTCIKKRF